jgi:hypothetical protein
LKVCYVCEYCGERLNDCQEGAAWSEAAGKATDPSVDCALGADMVMVKTICDECLVALGRTDDGFTSWLNGINVFRH